MRRKKHEVLYAVPEVGIVMKTFGVWMSFSSFNGSLHEDHSSCISCSRVLFAVFDRYLPQDEFALVTGAADPRDRIGC